jgi:hypothetical protein
MSILPVKNILVACEYSATVRDAFRRQGHNAFSCDVLPTDGDPEFHIQGDAREVSLSRQWHMVIAHPPCTYLAVSGVRWLHTQEGRWEKMKEGAEFFRFFLDLDVPYVAVENPVMHRYATEIIGQKQDQVVQPWMFGHPESKGTALWLKGLPLLRSTKNVYLEAASKSAKQRDRMHWAAPGPDRWKLRSKTYEGIATAMAKQWGRLL